MTNRSRRAGRPRSSPAQSWLQSRLRQPRNPLPPLEFMVKDSEGKDHKVTLRISYMPPTFLAKDKTKPASGRNRNARFEVRRENHGIAVCRNGRQIDVVMRNPHVVFMNNDRYLGFELNFPAELDEEFGVLCRVGLHCAPAAHRTIGTFPAGTVRWSLGLLNTEADVAEALAALESIVERVRQ